MANEDTVFFTAWLLTHDQDFQTTHRQVDPRVFPRGPLRYLVDLALRRHSLLTPTTVSISAEGEGAALRRAGVDDSRLVGRTYEALRAFAVEGAERDETVVLCGAWLQRRSLLVGVDAAADLLRRGDTAQAKEAIAKASYRLAVREEPSLLSKRASSLLTGQEVTHDFSPTGLYNLDRAWRGGIRPGELGLIMGPTGAGKSMVACSFAAQSFWANKYVMYYTSELTDTQILQRILLGIIQMGLEDIPEGSTWDSLVAKVARIDRRELPTEAEIEVQTTENMTMLDLKGALQTFTAEHGQAPGLLVLDSVDDVPMPGRFEKSYEMFRSQYTMLRALAQEFKVPIWVPVQANREAVDKARVSLKNLADAFAKAQKAHYVLGLAQTKEQWEDPDGPFMSVYILKDSLHGSTRAWMVGRCAFGQGENGYPGLEVEEAIGFQ